MKLITMINVILLAVSLFISDAMGGEKDFKYWDLGVGSYGAGGGKFDTWAGRTMLDMARMDWVFLTFGNPPSASKETTEMLNDYLKMNPDLKIMVRLWPLVYKRYEGETKHQPASFFDYLYEPGIKEKMVKKIDAEIDSVMKYIDKPEAVYGFLFIEELPFHFSDYGLDIVDPDKLPRDMKRYRAIYEKESGKTLDKWDADARRWYSKKFVEAVNDINAYIKKKSGGKKVFVYLATHYRPLDWVEKGEDINQWRVLAAYWKDMIKSGVADGFFAYNNNEFWSKRYTKLAQKHNWPYFSQLSQKGGMRLATWEKCKELAKKKIPQNLGYFLYVTGDDKQNAWNDNPDLTDEHNLGRASIRQNVRAICAKEKIGTDVLNRELKAKLQIMHNLGKVEKGGWAKIRLLIENPRDLSWYDNPKQVILEDIKVKLDIPDGFIIPESNSISAELSIGDLNGGEITMMEWWLKKTDDVPYSKDKSITITVSTANSLPSSIKSNKPEEVIIPQDSYGIQRSGKIWTYTGYRLKTHQQPMILTLECVAHCASRPSITAIGAYASNCKIIWNDCLRKGQKLVLGPGLKAVLYEKGAKDGKDVSDKLLGTPIVFGKELNKITYTDDDIPFGGEKLKITIKQFIKRKK